MCDTVTAGMRRPPKHANGARGLGTAFLCGRSFSREGMEKKEGKEVRGDTLQFGQPGSGKGQLNQPCGLAVDAASGNIVMADR